MVRDVDGWTLRDFDCRVLQDESGKRQEAERQRVSAQIEAERRATEQHKVRMPALACCAHAPAVPFSNLSPSTMLACSAC